MSELRSIQRIIGERLIPEARADQKALPTIGESMPIALELFYTALAMKPSHQPGARFVARRYAERMGLDGEALEAFAESRIVFEIDKEAS